jgi:hypothetical protein
MAAQVEARLTGAGHRFVTSLGDAATIHGVALSADRGMPREVVDLHHQTVTALDRLARLQAAAARLKAEPNAGACSANCSCAETVGACASSPAVPQSGVGLVLAASTGPDAPAIACTFDGGIDAMRIRVGDWQHVVGRATGRRPVADGVTLTYDHDEKLAVELARLAAAEYACCSFFTFRLAVGPAGMDFTVTAPREASDVVTAIFGMYGSALAGAQ